MERLEHPQRPRRCVTVLGGAVVLAGTLATVLAAQPPAAHPPSPPSAAQPPAAPPPSPLPPSATQNPLGPAPAPDWKPGGDLPKGAKLIPPPPPDVRVPFPFPPELVGVDLNKQSDGEVQAKSANCVGCHQNARDPHYLNTVHLGCVDCHGGNLHVQPPPGGCGPPGHGQPRGCPAAPPNKNPNVWRSSANPVRSYTVLNHESPDFIRFINPGDHRINHISCGTINCHPQIVLQSRKSMMTHGCMLWEAAIYNNGSAPNKFARFGENYSMHGVPLRVNTVPPPTDFEAKRGVVQFLDPLPRYENFQPANVLRIFERGGIFRPEIGIPEIEEDPGRPIFTRLSVRGLGTQNRTDPGLVSLEKTRLFNPTLNFLGTNDHPGDYRSSGCTACHIIYGNDRDRIHSGPYTKYGHDGTASDLPEDQPDPTIPKDEPGHPIRHRFAKGNAIPTSQCMICHVHPGTTVMNSYIGYMWWDEETDGEVMYPEEEKHPTAEEFINEQMGNPDEVATKGNWSDPEFVAKVADLNPRLKHTYFGDFHSHGWVFRAVFRHDRKGHLLDYNGHEVAEGPENFKKAAELPLKLLERYRNGASLNKTPQQLHEEEAHLRAGIPMHLVDVHVEKGMHCVDCHFVQDVHGNTRLQEEVRAAIEIACVDCHGTYTERARLRTSGVAAYTSNPAARDPENARYGRDLAAMRTPSGKPRFERRGNKIYQNSMVEPNLTWEVVQTMDTIDPQSNHYNAKSALAKTVRFQGDQMVWGQVPANDKHDDSGCAHSNKNMSCQACHSSWNPSCYGCHLPQKANMKMPQLNYDGDVTRNYVSYNFETLRDDVFMLARDGTATGNRINPSRSSCAIHVTSYNALRESIYYQQQTHSSEGFSGIAFSTNVPHTVSARNTTKMCTDCHVSSHNDNNAIMAQLLMQGTGYLNLIGRFAWVGAGEHGIFSVPVTEDREPQAVFGSYLHKLAWPSHYEELEKNGFYLKEAEEHPGKDISDNVFHPHCKPNITSLLYRGEYLYAACGELGVRVFDIAFANHKGFSEKYFTAPVSPLGQKFYVRTRYCTAVSAPSTLAPDPTRTHYNENQEGRIHAIYGYIYALDRYEGLITIPAATTINGNPLDNFLDREVTFNPEGILNGANAITFVGVLAYITCDRGLVIVDLNDPKHPEVKAVVDETLLKHPTAVQAQFRYCYVADEEAVKVFDITNPERPKAVSKIDIPHVHNIYLARTYAYLAAGSRGLVILDIERPDHPKVDQTFTADGCINDLHDVKLGITYNSEFAYLADGKNGMRIVQLTNPDMPDNQGFSPRPEPRLIATYKLPQHGHAVCISRGMDRDRAVDESGNQIAVFGRIGARPFNKEEQRKMYLHNDKLWTVSDEPEWSNYHKEPKK